MHQDMKVNIVYESHYGNGKKVAQNLSAVLKKKGQTVGLFSVKDTLPGEMPHAECYVFICPTRKFSLPPAMGNFLDALIMPKENVQYALITTYLDPRTIALKKMDQKLAQKGIKKAAQDLKIRVSGLRGPIKVDYRDRLEAFAEALVGSAA